MFKFEKRNEPLLAKEEYFTRILKHVFLGLAIILGSLILGILGYHFLENLNWLDSLLNASMILGGMGPVNALQTTSGKVFASFYALYSGMVFVVVAGIVLAPILHRFLHKFHLDEEGNG